MAPSLLPTILASVGDPGRTRTVYAAILFLVALGVALAATAVWIVRSTRRDPEVLAPLEVLGERRFRKLDPVWQRRRLDEVRPAGAVPLSPTPPLPPPDDAFEAGPQATGFDDLSIDELLADPLLADPPAPAPPPEPEGSQPEPSEPEHADPEHAAAQHADPEHAPPADPEQPVARDPA